MRCTHDLERYFGQYQQIGAVCKIATSAHRVALTRKKLSITANQSSLPELFWVVIRVMFCVKVSQTRNNPNSVAKQRT